MSPLEGLLPEAAEPEAEPQTATLLQSVLQRLKSEIRSENFIAVEKGHERYLSCPTAQRFIRCLWDLQPSFRIPHYLLPILSVQESDAMEEERIRAGYDYDRNVVYIPERAWKETPDDPYQLGDKIGEELFGHSYRFHHLFRHGEKPRDRFPLGGQMERGDVEEFFGFLGRKLLYRMLAEQGAASVLFPKGQVTPPKNPTIVEKEIQGLRDALGKWYVFGHEKKKLQREVDSKEGHCLGYARAYSLNSDAIPWERMRGLYSFSTEEVVNRFFRD